MDLEGIERATVAAVAPAKTAEVDGWIIALDSGTIGRGHSAAPLRFDMTADQIGEIEALYAAEGLPTLLKTGSIAAMKAAGPSEPAELIATPDQAWASVFVGEGFDPVDGLNRVEAFTRSPGALYGRVRDGDRTVAVGVMSFHGSWASIHGMRTNKDARGKGAASRILATLAAEAYAQGYEDVFLQVVEDNPARAIYRRFGFERRRRYFYWRKA